MDRLAQEIRIAVRGLRRAPTFTATSVLILGLGIGMAAAMWTVFNAVLLRGLPVSDQGSIVLPRSLDRAGVDAPFQPQEVDMLRRGSRTMRAVVGFAHWGSGAWPLVDGDRPIFMHASQVDGNFFDVLGVKPVLGRLLHPGEDSTSHAMVLSYEAWQRQFAGDRSILGRRLTDPVNENTYTIIGVAAPGLGFPVGAEFWVIPPFPQQQDIIARLAPNATPAAARAEFLAIAQRIDRQRPAVLNVATADIRGFSTAIVGDVRPALTVLTAAVGLLLLIACVNVGNLLLLRAASRHRELAVRRALGAAYGDVVRPLLIESGLLAGAGGLLGLVCAEIGRRALVAAAPSRLPRLDAVRVAGLPVGTVAGIALLSVLLFGVVPALTAVRRNPTGPIRLDERSGRSTRRGRSIRQLLVASQIALAVLMLAGAGLLARTLQRLETVDLGYRSDHLSFLPLTFPPSEYATERKWHAMLDALLSHLAVAPGVTAATPVIVPPFLGPNVWTRVFQAEGQSDAEAATNPMTPIEAGGPDYFRAFNIPIVRGRAFLDTDREQGPDVAVVSAALARQYWPGQDPVGKRIKFVGDSMWRTVVGVAGDIRYRALRQATPTVFVPWRQYAWQGFMVVRTTTPLARTLGAIRSAVRGANPRVTVWRAQTMDELLDGPLAQPRLNALLLSGFGLVALVLAAIGLYGIMASAVREQTREIRVRMALGASPDRVRGEVLGRALRVAGIGAAVGVGGALVAARLVASLLFEVSPFDPVALAGACAVLFAVAALAAYLPARRATRIAPASALRSD